MRLPVGTVPGAAYPGDILSRQDEIKSSLPRETFKDERPSPARDHGFGDSRTVEAIE